MPEVRILSSAPFFTVGDTFLSVFIGARTPGREKMANENSKRILVTSALRYATGPVHIGHVAGAYLPADIYVRYERLKGADVIHIGGTDEYGVPVTVKAEQEGVSPQEVVDSIL